MNKKMKETISYSVDGITGEEKVSKAESFIEKINEIFQKNEISLNKKEKTKATGYFKISLDFHENGFNLHIEPKIKEFQKQFDNAKTVRDIANISGLKTGLLGGLLAFAVQELSPDINKEWVSFIKEHTAKKMGADALAQIIEKIEYFNSPVKELNIKKENKKIL